MNELTTEQKQDVEERTKKFLEGYQALVSETQIDFGQMPQYVPLGNGLFGTVIFNQPTDKKYLPVPSNLENLK